MLKRYNKKDFFFYKESMYLCFFSRLGSCKLYYKSQTNYSFYTSNHFFFFTRLYGFSLLSIQLSSFLRPVSSVLTSLFYGHRTKFGHRGKRVRMYYSSTLFFLKLGYSSRVPFLLPLDVLSFKKEKKIPFYTLLSLKSNSLSKCAFQISSFRLIDPYNFGGIMLREGYFKYSRWLKKTNVVF